MQRFFLQTLTIFFCLTLGNNAFAKAKCNSRHNSEIKVFLENMANARSFQGLGLVTFYDKKEVKENVTGEIIFESVDSDVEMSWKFCGKDWCSAERGLLSLKTGCLQMEGKNLRLLKASQTSLSFSRSTGMTKDIFKLRISPSNILKFNVAEMEEGNLMTAYSFWSHE